ncbi:MAG: hypothetical protein WC294_00040 [Methanoregula sp.]|jgi:hypothetical protein
MFGNSLSHFTGINNIDEPTRIATQAVKTDAGWKTAYPLTQASNVYIHDTYDLVSRGGYTSALSGTDIHSLWSDETICFFVDGGSLYQLQTDYSITLVRSGLASRARMSYAPVNDRVYYSNGFQIGYVKDMVDYALMDPLREFKMPLPAGKFIEYYKGCLYVAVKNILYIADPLCDYYDARTGYRVFAKDITMLRSVDHGLFVSDDRIWFIKGETPEEFVRAEVYPSKAIPYTDIKINGKFVGEGVDGDVAMWTSENGICLGANTGEVVNMTHDKYLVTPTARGSAMIKELSNERHYINTLY